MALQAPTHILPALRFCDRHLSDISVAGFAGDSGIDMRLVIKFDEIWLNSNRYPGNRLVISDVLRQFIQFGRFLVNLLMAAPAFVVAGQAGRWT